MLKYNFKVGTIRIPNQYNQHNTQGDTIKVIKRI